MEETLWYCGMCSDHPCIAVSKIIPNRCLNSNFTSSWKGFKANQPGNVTAKRILRQIHAAEDDFIDDL